MSDKEKITLLASDGMLIKRPLLITKEKIYVGFKEKEWEELTKQKVIKELNFNRKQQRKE